MNRVLTASLVGAAFVGLALASPLATAKSGGSAAIPLNAAQETTGSTSAGGGFFEYSIDGSELCYTLSVKELSMAPFAAHIHRAGRNVAGPINVTLVTPPAATSTVSACVTADGAGDMTSAELAAIIADPRAFYVNVHTTNWPGGEVRGQLK